MPALFITLMILLCLLAVSSAGAVSVSILVTSDEHGTRMFDDGLVAGPAEMLTYWRDHEGYKPGKFLVLSSGDFNYGDALNILCKGDPLLAVMKEMGYKACALGNADIGSFSKQMPHWSSMAGFPLLAANITRADGKPVQSVLPYTVTQMNGLGIGIVGLTAADATHVTSLDKAEFVILPYVDTLRKIVPKVRAKGAQVVIVLAHEGHDVLVDVAEQVKDLNIPLILGGHWHKLKKSCVCDQKTWVIESGCHWHAYSRIDLEYDAKSDSSSIIDIKQVSIRPPLSTPDAEVSRIVSIYQSMYAQDYEKIGYTTRGLISLDETYQFVCDCLVAADDQADMALLTSGHLRQGIPPGSITRMSIQDSMNYTNVIYRLQLSGRQVLDYINQGSRFSGMSGIRNDSGNYVISKTNSPLDPAVAYHILVSEYMYQTESPMLRHLDSKPQVAFTNWRQPVIDWLISHHTSESLPLEAAISQGKQIR